MNGTNDDRSQIWHEARQAKNEAVSAAVLDLERLVALPEFEVRVIPVQQQYADDLVRSMRRELSSFRAAHRVMMDETAKGS